MKIAIIGLGYIGLPTAASFAAAGHSVFGVDTDQRKLQLIADGLYPTSETGLESLLETALDDGLITFVSQPPAADVYIISVPTPLTADKRIDDTFLRAVIHRISRVIQPGALVIIESTISPGTTRKMAEELMSFRQDIEVELDSSPQQLDNSRVVYFAHCPERILPGQALRELRTNDRVIGGLSDQAGFKAAAVYSEICEGQLFQTSALTAEMTKLTENAFRDVNIAFANELSILCDLYGVDVWELIGLANRHPRVNVLNPGPGVGGHCIAVDPWFLAGDYPDSAKLITTARSVNNFKPGWVADKLLSAPELKANPTLAIFGLSFKANIDDLRESPSIKVIQRLSASDPTIRILVVEPHISLLPPELETLNARLVSPAEALESSAAVGVLVDHDQFRSIDFSGFQNTMLDLRAPFRTPPEEA